MAEYEVTDHGDGTYTVREVTSGGGSGSADLFTIPGTIFYFLGFIGIFTMLFQLSETMVVFGLLALLLYLSPLLMVILARFLRPNITDYDGGIFDKKIEPFTYKLYARLTDGGNIFKNVFKNFIGPYAYIVFNLFLAIFWIGFIQGTVSETTQIALIIPCAYSMYYFPFVLIYNAIKRKSKFFGIITAIIIFFSLVVFLAFYDQLMNVGGGIAPAVFFTSLTVFGTLALLVSNLIFVRKKRGHLILLLLYLLLLVTVIVSASVMIL